MRFRKGSCLDLEGGIARTDKSEKVGRVFKERSFMVYYMRARCLSWLQNGSKENEPFQKFITRQVGYINIYRAPYCGITLEILELFSSIFTIFVQILIFSYWFDRVCYTCVIHNFPCDFNLLELVRFGIGIQKNCISTLHNFPSDELGLS